MYSKIKVLGHPVHPMFVSFPIAFYTVTFLGFFAYAFNANPFLYKVSYYSNICGVAAALVAAIPGFLDLYLGVPKQSVARKRGILHGALNVIALALFATNMVSIWGTADQPPLYIWPSLVLTGLGFLITVAAGYQGFALIGTNKVGVDLTPEQEIIERARDTNRAA